RFRVPLGSSESGLLVSASCHPATWLLGLLSLDRIGGSPAIYGLADSRRVERLATLGCIGRRWGKRQVQSWLHLLCPHQSLSHDTLVLHHDAAPGHPAMHTALEISELVGSVVQSLDTLDDVAACALVARKWAYPAQSRLFSVIIIWEPHRQLPRLLDVFEQSPHLPTFIVTLAIQPIQYWQPAHFERLSNIAYPILTGLSVGCQIQSLPGTPQIVEFFRRMLSIPTLTSVTMQYGFATPEPYFKIWQNCSQSIRHLDLTHNPRYSGSSLTESHPRTKHIGRRVVLDSVVEPSHMLTWLNDPWCPFDVSKLRAIKIYSSARVPWSSDFLVAAQNTVEIISIHVWSSSDIDLSPFTRINQLDLSPGTLTDGIGVVKTISAPTRSRIRAIRFYMSSMELQPRLLEIADLLPNLKVVVVLSHVCTPELTKGVEEYVPLGPGVEVRWNFNAQAAPLWHVPIRVD
ncbi:hypothetical protein FB45DRAFT_300543, partial [Roridomyces roridus]